MQTATKSWAFQKQHAAILYHLKMLFRIQVHQNLIDITLNMRLRGVAETYHDENCHISDKISSLRFLCTNLKKFVCVMN